jgi:hypothetical protein
MSSNYTVCLPYGGENRDLAEWVNSLVGRSFRHIILGEFQKRGISSKQENDVLVRVRQIFETHNYIFVVFDVETAPERPFDPFEIPREY